MVGQPRHITFFLVAERAISEELRARMLGWRHSGFSVHNQVRVAADDADGRKKLAGYMLRRARAAKIVAPATISCGVTEVLSEVASRAKAQREGKGPFPSQGRG